MSSPAPPDRRDHRTRVAQVVDRNIRALLERRQRDERERSARERVADAITRFTGSMMFVVIHLVLVGAWIAINLGWVPGVPRFDPSFVILAMAASVEAIFLSTFVLITQNRMQQAADQRADLDLQVSLLAEYEITQVLTLVREIASKMDVEAARDPELSELEREVEPVRVLDQIERRERQMDRLRHRDSAEGTAS